MTLTQRTLKRAIFSMQLADFSGGLNLRDSPNELAPNETPDALNWTLDQRGTLKWRKGCLNIAALPGVSGKAAYIFYSEGLDQWLCVRETTGAPNTTKLWTHGPDLTSGSWTDRGAISLSLATQVAFVDWPGATPMVVLSSADTWTTGSRGTITGGIYTWDGTTLTLRTSTTGAGGYALALWQNRVWAAGYPVNSANGHVCTLFASKIGDPAVWAVASGGLTVDLRVKDASRLTALGLAGGSLVVFKAASAYRLNDSDTGAYSLIDSAAGCVSPLAIVAQRGRLYSWGADSLYEWDGIGPGQRVGDKALPLFATDAALVGGAPALCGGALSDRMLFAYPLSAGATNRGLLEYDPQHGWLVKHRLAGSGQDEISSFARQGADLYGAVRDGDVIFKMFSETAGGDVGSLATTNYRTPWLEPNGGKLCRIQRANIEGLLVSGGTNTLTLNVYRDGDLSSVQTFSLTSDLRAGSATDQQQMSTVRALGHGRSFAFEFVPGTAAGDASIQALTLEGTVLEY